MAIELRSAPRARTKAAARPARPHWLLFGALVVSLVWRLPSLFDPPWVNDEGTYFAVAQAMAHGYRLYANVWENKPPALYLAYSAVYHLVGPSLLAVRVLASLVALSVVVLVYRLARPGAGREPASAAAMLVGLLLAVPFLEGTTANAELFLIVCTSLGVYLAFVQERIALAGLVMGAAVLFKVVGGFDAFALGLWLLLHQRRAVLPYLTGVAVPVIGCLGLALAAGILMPMLRDAVLYDLGYVGRGNGGGVPWVLAVKLAGLALLTLGLRRAPFPYLWLLYAAAGALVSGRFFGHYALQMVPALAVSVALVLHGRRRWAHNAVAVLPLGFALAAVLSAATGWAMAAAGHDSILARRLQWYANATRLAVGAETNSTYRSQIDDRVNRNIGIARMLRSLPPGRMLAWGNIPWVYVLARRLPATPYTSALRDPPVPGETDALRRSLIGGSPVAVVVVDPPAPPLGRAARSLRLHYRRVTRIGNSTVYVRR